MKRLFTLAILTMIASLTFAQTPSQTKKSSVKKIEKVVRYDEAKATELKSF